MCLRDSSQATKQPTGVLGAAGTAREKCWVVLPLFLGLDPKHAGLVILQRGKLRPMRGKIGLDERLGS